MTHNALLLPLLLAASGTANRPTAGHRCHSAGESLIETVLSEKGPSPEDAWTLAGCFWPEMTAALLDAAPVRCPDCVGAPSRAPSPGGVDAAPTRPTALDAALVELVRLHVGQSLATEKPSFPDSLSAARKLFAFLLEARPPDAGVVVSLMGHPELHAEAIQALRDHINLPNVVRELGRALSDPRRKDDALALLNQVRGPAAVPVLAEFSRQPDEWVRGEIAWLLGRTGAVEALPHVAQAMKDESARVRYNAVWALSLLPRPQSAALNRTALTDPDPMVRRAAAAVAGQCLDREAVQQLLGLLRDTNSNVKVAAIDALEALEDRSTTSGLIEVFQSDPDPEVRTNAGHALSHFPDDLVRPAFEKALDDRHPPVRTLAAQALDQLDSRRRESAASVCKKWKRKFERLEDAEKLNSILETAGKKGKTPPECLSILSESDLEPDLAALARAAAAVRGDSMALKSLGVDSQDPSYRRALFHFMQASEELPLSFVVAVLRSGHVETKRALAPALVRVQDPGVMDVLFRTLPDPDLHGGAYSALGQWAVKPGHAQSFAGALENPALRRWASEILMQARTPAAVRELEETLSHPSPVVREAVAQILGNIEDPGSTGPLGAAAQDPVGAVRKRAVTALGNLRQPSAIPVLVRGLADTDASVRFESAWSLARTMREGRIALDNPAAVEALRHALSEPDPDLRFAAAGAFMIIKRPEVIPDLREHLLKDPDSTVRKHCLFALVQLPDREATDALAEALRHSDAELRFRAVQALADRMDQDTRSKIEKLRKTDPSPLVRQAALEALK